MRLLTLLLISSLSVMAGATVAPALPEMARAFSGWPEAEHWVRRMLTLPALTATLGGPIAGLILDRFGRRPLLLSALALYAFAGAAGLFVPNLGWLLASRALLGFSLAAIITAATTLIADYWNEAERGRVLGFQAAFAGFAGVLFLIGGGFLADIHWRVPFALYLLAALYFPLARRHLPEVWKRPQPAQVGKSGEDLDLPPLSRLGIIYSLAFVLMAAFFLVPIYMPFRLELISEVDASGVGMMLGSVNLCFALTALLYKRMSGLFRVSALFATGFVVFGSGLGILGLARSVPWTLPGLALSGVGLGILIPNLNVWATRGLELRVRGRVVGGLTTSLYFGQFAAPFVAQPLVQRVGLDRGFIIYAATLGALALPFSIRAWRRRGRPIIG